MVRCKITVAGGYQMLEGNKTDAMRPVGGCGSFR